MKPLKIKTFKCSKCKNIFPIFKLDQFGKKLIDVRKYWHGEINCKRCWNRNFNNRKLKVVKKNNGN